MEKLLPPLSGEDWDSFGFKDVVVGRELSAIDWDDCEASSSNVPD